MTTFETPNIYNDPAGGSESSVGPQIRTDFYKRKALVEAAKEMYFGQLADVTNMPKNFGKTIKMYHYLPILDDRNVSDQGIDASGVSLAANFVANTTIVSATIELLAPAADGGDAYYVRGDSTGANFNAARDAAQDQAQNNAWAWAIQQGYSDGSEANYAAFVVAIELLGWDITELNTADDFYITATIHNFS